MGVVYKAEDTRLHRIVALKLLAPHFSSDPDQKTRFLREGHAAAAIHHANVCTIFEVGEEHAFLAMEFVEGPSLKEMIAERPLPLEQGPRDNRELYYLSPDRKLMAVPVDALPVFTPSAPFFTDMIGSWRQISSEHST